MIVPICCSDDSNKKVGCSDKVVDLFEKYGLKVFLAAAIVFLVVEVLFLIAVPYLIWRASRAPRPPVELDDIEMNMNTNKDKTMNMNTNKDKTMNMNTDKSMKF